MGEVFLAGEEAHERAALLRGVVADSTAQHGIAGFKCVEHRTLRNRAFDFEGQLLADVRQRSQMLREYDADHVATSAIFRIEAYSLR
jgi:hypothetical protein